MLTKQDLTNIVTGMLVTNQNKTDQEKSELIMQFLEKENCLKVEKEEDDFILNVILTIAIIIASDVLLYIIFVNYKNSIKYISNSEQTITNFIFVIAFIVINILPIFIIHKSIKQKKWKQIEKK